MAKILEKISKGFRVTKGTKIKIPIGGEALIYGFVPFNEDELFEFSILNDLNGPALGPAYVIGNRIIFSLDGKFSRFPIFTSIQNFDEEKYPIYLLYVPKLLNSPNSTHVGAYKYSMKNEKPHKYIGKVEGVKILDDRAYYFPNANEFFFTSQSCLRGLANSFAVITQRKSGDNEMVVYEVFDPTEIEIID